VKKFTIPCDFGEIKAPFNIYVGEPAPGSSHPLQHQSAWLSRERGGTIPPEVMESFAKLLDISRENGVSFEDLCVYALGTASGQNPVAPGEASTEGASTEGASTEEASTDKAATSEGSPGE
jgi:hypothetical protein